MRRRCTALLTAALFCCGVAPSARAETLPEPIVSGDAKFAIPVDVAAGPDAPAELRLYLSEDLGRTWRLFMSAKPPLEGFDFAAPAEREYWFHVRTVDAQGIETPTGPMTPELRVVVDTTPPKLELKAERTKAGGVIVKWNLDDAHAAADTFKLSYRSMAGGQQVREIVPSRSKRQGDEHSAAGEIEWLPDDAGKIVVRAEAADLAENRTTTELTVAEAAGPGVELPRAAAAPLPQPSPTLLAPAAPIGAAPPSALSAPTDVTASQTARPAAAPRDPLQPMMVNSASFELDYDLRREGTAPVTKVEVWGTRDDGRHWVLLGVDDDRQSPTSVSVDGEGLYGFAVTVHTATVPGTPPKAGDAPEIRVGVDLTLPRVRLTTAEPDAEGRACALKINWEANDAHLGTDAVSLSYAASPQGPWLPLASQTANTGHAVCHFDPQGPDQAFLKLEVRDQAGNVGRFTTTAPIPIDKRPAPFRMVGTQSDNGKQRPAPKWFHVLR